METTYYQVQHFTGNVWKEIQCAKRLSSKEEAIEMATNFRKAYTRPQNIRAVKITESAIA